MGMTSQQQEALQKLLNYPLIDALTHRRSRRFSMGATLPTGGLAYASQKEPLPLTMLEEAILAFAAAGINGFCLGELPYAPGDETEAAGGNVMASLLGRTGASADAVHSTSLFVINDRGTYLLKRPQDYSLEEIDDLSRMAIDRRYEDVYEKMRVRVRDTSTSIIKEVPNVFPFNKWSTNLPGTTYFLPVCDLTAMYINILLSMFDEQMAMFIVDEREGLRPAGIARFGVSRGGKLKDDLNGDRIVPILNLETAIVEFMVAEQAFMLHNLSLMEQAMGLGGWTHYATAREVSWFEALGFRMGSQRFTQVVKTGFFASLFLNMFGAKWPQPHPLGLTVNGKDLIKPFCPPFYRSMEEAVLAFIDLKRKNLHDASLRPSFSATWKNSNKIQASIPEFSDACIAATIAYCTYLYETYGRFPANFGPLRSTLAHQAHHLDLDFYDKFYQAGAYTQTQAEHLAQWH